MAPIIWDHLATQDKSTRQRKQQREFEKLKKNVFSFFLFCFIIILSNPYWNSSVILMSSQDPVITRVLENSMEV